MNETHDQLIIIREDSRDQDDSNQHTRKRPLQLQTILKCSRCATNLPDDGKERKRARRRMCDTCKLEAERKRRKESPQAVLRSRWYSATYRKNPNIRAELRSLAAVELVYNRWEGKSVISGNANPKKLCITWYKTFDRDEDITLNDLVLVTSDESQALAKIKDQNLRVSRFPPEVRAKIDQKEGVQVEWQ